jgi:hypothetical protein
MVAMGIFHRSTSHSSHSSSDRTTPRSSTELDTNHFKNNSDHHKETPEKQDAPILTLPLELIQHITTYLGPGASASFSLTSRYIYYALGSDCLTRYINKSKNRFAKRQTIEAVVERAFPAHWFCAWCDVFHKWSGEGTGPKVGVGSGKDKGRDCAEFNSYLEAGDGYVLRFHHIRLALAHHLHGPAHGIPLSSLSYSHTSMESKIYRTPVQTTLSIMPKIWGSRLLLHTSFTLTLPAWTTSRKHILTHIWNVLPHVLIGHRDSDNGHTGLMAAIDNVVRRGWKYPFTQNCGSCRTDWTVSAHTFGPQSQVRLVIQTWRDLGDGKSPFDQGWRAHGVPIVSVSYHSQPGVERYEDVRAGDVRRAFETLMEEPASSPSCPLPMKERAISPARTRIYQAFMRRESGDEVRRSRARPNVWRTASENEDVERRSEEERREVARQVAESLVRLDAWRRTRAPY